MWESQNILLRGAIIAISKRSKKYMVDWDTILQGNKAGDITNISFIISEQLENEDKQELVEMELF